MKPLILSIEDDAQMASLLKTLFEISEYPMIQARNGKEALRLFLSEKPDLDGKEIIRKIREFAQTPILVLSARSEDTDKIEALDLGADDYLTKPFSVEELLARIRVISRRMEQSGVIPAQTIFVNGGLEIHYEEQEVYLDHKRLHLTPLEYRLIVLFSKNPGKVLTRNYITKQIWNSTFESDMSNLRVYMTMLRKKLDHRFIETNFGVGYKMVREENCG